jgi:hypothetical protein
LQAGKYLINAGFTQASNTLRCYALCGYKGDTFDKATARMLQIHEAGFFPFAMLYKNEKGDADPEWKTFQREWARPHIVATNLKKITNKKIKE